jgi:hypothetical protein
VLTPKTVSAEPLLWARGGVVIGTPPRRPSGVPRNKPSFAPSFLSMLRKLRVTRPRNVNVDEGHYLTVAWCYVRVMYIL